MAESVNLLVAAVGRDAGARLAPLCAGADAHVIEAQGLAVAWLEPLVRAPQGNAGAFVSADGQCRGVLAGHVFNLEELLAEEPELAKPEIRLGDLMQRLIRQHGWEFGRCLDGAWVMVLQNGRDVWAVRDAIGERILYMHEGPRGLLLADGITPLLRHPECERVLDPGGITDFLSAGFCPFDRTPIRGISKIPAGAVRRLAPTLAGPEPYHRLTDEDRLSTSETDQAATLRGALNDAVAKRQVDGERPALLLSGGLDSSLVGALLGDAEFSAAYSLSFDERYANELEFSAMMATHLQLEHRVVVVTPEMVRDTLVDTLRVIDEPIGDPLTVPNYVVAREMAAGNRVIFNGEGGDPLFGGPKNPGLLAAAAFAPHAAPPPWGELYMVSYNKGYQHLPEMLSKGFMADLQPGDMPSAWMAPWFDNSPMKSFLNTLMHINLRLKGASQILPKVYKVSRAHGLLAQSPLFDRTVAELSFAIAPDLKLRGTCEKYLLKEAVRDIVPQRIVDRPKSGMLVPVHGWFHRELRDYAADLLLSARSVQRGIFQRQEVANLLAFRDKSVRRYVGARIWLLISLEAWLLAHDL